MKTCLGLTIVASYNFIIYRGEMNTLLYAILTSQYEGKARLLYYLQENANLHDPNSILIRILACHQ